mgnify:CR=1 FL=1
MIGWAYRRMACGVARLGNLSWLNFPACELHGRVPLRFKSGHSSVLFSQFFRHVFERLPDLFHIVSELNGVSDGGQGISNHSHRRALSFWSES